MEINALATHPAFLLFKPPSDGAEVGSLEFIKQAASAIEQLALQWLKLIGGVCDEI